MKTLAELAGAMVLISVLAAVVVYDAVRGYDASMFNE